MTGTVTSREAFETAERKNQLRTDLLGTETIYYFVTALINLQPLESYYFLVIFDIS